ncbi:D-alanine--D-alanine ligase [Sansalvadorimonas sp. 2012CJ34-2]|uniref:D-alanine--D-alanine ligase n=1 Tax=Parendozoicomonas callyspongiae TaxID=2942213 RepID=A0ABT0PCM4_9GAMM|nr:D-alanine--D-alanine ligase [Sansalvadorimonas sp. 2012CJ34-2]MCL6269099.1 D-alanine--D-alanine ligase [Sansalvadorimonas sp. 2012CJ34-2]
MPGSQLVVVILCGGRSPEATVSRLSAGRIQGVLARHYDNLHVLELDRHVATELERIKPDVVFPLLHGPYGEDGTIQGLLDTLEIPYIGSGVHPSAICMDKHFTKRLLEPLGVALARSILVRREEGLDRGVDNAIQALSFPVVVKPRSLGSTIAIRVAHNREELLEHAQTAFDLEPHILIEEFIPGREVTVSIIERPTPVVMPVLEIRTPNQVWYDYDHKYTPGLCEHLIPAPIPEEQYQYCQDWALKIHHELGLRDLSRTDFMVPEEGDPVFLEVNTMPGMTPTSLLPDAVENFGLSILDMAMELINNAITRGPRP